MAHKPSICTVSLGRCSAGHSMASKLDAARDHGFRGIEVFYEDLVDLAKSSHGGDSPASQIAAADNIHTLCEARGLTIICLQPFLHYEALVDREEHQRRIEEMHLWMDLVHALHTDLILIPSSCLPLGTMSDDIDHIVQDLTEVADIGLAQSPPVRFAYEALCWGTRVDLWEQSWDVVQAVDRPNFGLCLDTFNLAGRIYADPMSSSGKTVDADAILSASLQRIVRDVDVQKLFLVQIADGERLSGPLNEHHPFYNAEQPPRMSWSRNARLFYGERQQGAYLPVKEVMEAIVHGLGFEGWLSFEVFNREFYREENGVPDEMATRGEVSWHKMVRDLSLKTASGTAGLVQAML